MTQDKGNIVFPAEISYPVPGKNAFDSHGNIFPIRLDDTKKLLPVRGHVAVKQDISFGIKNTDIHFPGMQIDSTVEFMLICIELHGAPPC
jgi:hypothetical protein